MSSSRLPLRERMASAYEAHQERYRELIRALNDPLVSEAEFGDMVNAMADALMELKAIRRDLQLHRVREEEGL